MENRSGSFKLRCSQCVFPWSFELAHLGDDQWAAAVVSPAVRRRPRRRSVMPGLAHPPLLPHILHNSSSEATPFSISFSLQTYFLLFCLSALLSLNKRVLYDLNPVNHQVKEAVFGRTLIPSKGSGLQYHSNQSQQTRPLRNP